MAILHGDEKGSWQTVICKRQYLGDADAGWAGGVGATLRIPVYLSVKISKIRISGLSQRDVAVELQSAGFAKAGAQPGSISGEVTPITFNKSASASIPAGSPGLNSDEIPVSAGPGLYYLQEIYSSPKYGYSGDESGTYNASTHPDQPYLIPGNWFGNINRIDVFTDDPKPVIACYGDSITQGCLAKEREGRYPAALAKLMDQTVLNLGVNGDVAIYTGGTPLLFRSVNGVGPIVFLMGINDIIGSMKTPDEYAGRVGGLIAALHADGHKVYIGTIMPAEGQPGFDSKPEHETLRQGINQWIREKSGADGVVDFDKGLQNPAHPTRLLDAYQSDHIHPNDAGYKKMAELVAAELKKSPAAK